MNEITLRQAMTLLAENGQAAMPLTIQDGADAPVELMSVTQALELHANRTITHIAPYTAPDGQAGVTCILGPAVEPGIVVCVLGGIVNDVYVKSSMQDPGVLVLDVDDERPDADAIQALWDKVADDPDYVRADHEFYDPLGSEAPDVD